MIELDIKIRAKDQETVKYFSDMISKALKAANDINQIDISIAAEKDGDTITIVRKEIIKSNK